MKRAVVLVAGGSGNRMNSELPKQFITIGKYPILIYTLLRFYKYDPFMKIHIVLPEAHIEKWKEIIRQFKIDIPHEIRKGGEIRFDSVRNGITGLDENFVVGIHDGVRPFVSSETIDRCYRLAEKKGNAIPVIKVKESVRKKNENSSKSLSRDDLYLVQTPQVFKSEVLLEAYKQPYHCNFTDDASVIEAFGHSIHIVDGNPENIKITEPIDLLFAETLIKYTDLGF